MYSLETRFIPLTAAFSSLHQVIKGLRRIHDLERLNALASPQSTTADDTEPFESEENDIASYNHNLNGLLKRWSSTVELMNTTLSLRNQSISLKQSNQVTTLTKASVDDSASIHVITFITLIYLSFTGVAVGLPNLDQLYREHH